jgi:N,N-dimethylformamidase
VGFTAQGFDRGTHYVRLEDSFSPAAAFVFEGIADGERIGDFGIMGGGAAGAEIDAFVPSLGAPPQSLVLATSAEFPDTYLIAQEEILETLPMIGGTENPAVRSDIVLCPMPGGGGVFSVGSIAYTAALSHNGYDNNVARITTNVLQRFLDEAPLVGDQPM